MSLGNGWTVIEVKREPYDKGGRAPGAPSVTLYLRIPPELATPIEGGCSCQYCKAHPELVPMWDALAVCDAKGDHSWTVHYPEARRQL